MAINHVVRFFASLLARRLRDNHWITGSSDELCFQPDLLAVRHHPFSTLLQITFVLRLSGDAGEPDIIAKVLEKTCFIFFEIIENGLHKSVFLLLTVGTGEASSKGGLVPEVNQASIQSYFLGRLNR